MKNLLYIFVASALITILPFLITFEKGQNIVRGLFEYGVFAVLLFYVFFKEKCVSRTKLVFIAMCYILLVLIAFIDLYTILFVKGKNVGFYGIIPIVGPVVALFILNRVKGISLNKVNVILFVSFFAHFVAMKVCPEQPLFQFSIPLYLTQQNQPVDRTRLPDDFRSHYNATDSVTVTRNYVDVSRSNVLVLVESWGIPIDSAKFNEELAVFEEVLKERGVHHRMYSRTRTAEREDLLDSVKRDLTGKRDSLFMLKRFAELGYTTTFLFGGDSAIQWRYKYIRNIGFQNAVWTDSVTADSVMAAKIDSLLKSSMCDSLADSACANRQFIVWTTRDTRFPISDDPVETENNYYERLFGTLKIVADLAKKHPDVRFVVQGDHEPILSPLEFQAKFYRRWVPYVVLN